MELQISRDTLSTAGSFCTVKSELPIETEILISDYLPQVFKIVKCFVKMVVLQKQLQTNRLSLDGYLRCIVYYQGENGQGICQTEQKIPFSRAIDLPMLDFSTYSIVVGGETEYLNCRAVNQRRVEVRGAYEISAAIYPQIQQEVIASISDCGAQQKQIPISGMRCVASVDKLISADAEFTFDQPPAAVLDLSGVSTVREIKLLSGKAVIKGDIQIEIVYRSAENTALRAQRVPVSFHQILDLDGITETCSCFCSAEAVGFTVTEDNSEQNTHRLSVSALLHVRAYKEQNSVLVSDVFSTLYETNSEYNIIAIEAMEKQLEETTTLSVNGPLPDENAQLIACFVSFGLPESVTDGVQTGIKARGVITIFCENSLNEIESYEKPLELLIPIATKTTPQDLHLECWLTVRDISCTVRNGALDAAITVQAEGVLLRRQTYTAVSEVELGPQLSPCASDVALRIYYAQGGEDLFDISRQFHVSPAEMRVANNLTEDSLTAPCRLLVPSIR